MGVSDGGTESERGDAVIVKVKVILLGLESQAWAAKEGHKRGNLASNTVEYEYWVY